MNEYIKQSQNRAKTSNSVFILSTLGIFLLLSSFLFAIDFVPEQEVIEAHNENGLVQTVAPEEDSATVTVLEENTTELILPTRIIVESIGIDTPVITPASDDVSVLDRALLLGAVYYPGSGTLGANGNVLIFGHSSYLPVVNNKAFKAFNELRKLDAGDTIVVESERYQYVYEVLNVQLSTASEARIDFDSNFPMLTLATCNNFGEEEERWIVTARLISKQSLI